MNEQELVAMWKNLDRSRFLPKAAQSLADIDGPLPIGFGQTISQPSLVLEMTRLLCPDSESRVLEIGTGSGYQTALLAPFSHRVHTVERIPELAKAAEERLADLGYTNIRFHVSDGSQGWPEAQPYDRIMVTAAAGQVPDPLLEQLAPGGRMVLPAGPRYAQDLLLVTKNRRRTIHTEAVLKVSFVELVGPYGWGKDR